MNDTKYTLLRITDASENNLKHVDVSIPHQSLTVITGVSGSGKSSLAYNVIFRESQRRFLASFSAFSRQYLGKLEKPKVKDITGLQAALAINQKTSMANPRSTLGTMSGIYDYLRLLYARVGERYCCNCKQLIADKKALSCPNCQSEQPKLQASLFSFNSKHGACARCNGLGLTEQIDQRKLIADENRTLREGALVPTTPTGYIVYSQVRVDELDKVCRAHGFSVDIPWKELTQEQRDVVMFGSDRIKILFGKHELESRLKWKGITAKPREEAYYKGMIPIMEEILKRDRNDNILRFASSFTCTHCGGSRLREEARNILIDGKNISELSNYSLAHLHQYLKELSGNIQDRVIFDDILSHVFKRLEYMSLLGLDYLTLDRESTTLSGGESQRTRLASQVGSGLQGILYILDEPSIGLHPRDNKKMLEVLKSLRDNGNTVLVVEHDETTIKAADYLIDIGPKAGLNGGKVLFQGLPEQLFKHIENHPESITAQSISFRKKPAFSQHFRPNNGIISLVGATRHNLKDIAVEIKQQAFNVITGVSGAGKSTLVGLILDNLKHPEKASDIKSISCQNPIDRIIDIDQSPIGRTPRSNPATYTNMFDHIRDLFAKQPESKKRDYPKGRFSFNNIGGRCETCQGAGYLQLGMHFLGDVEITCDVCDGKRFNNDTLEVKFNDKNIYDVLELSIDEARTFFEGQRKITSILDQLIKLDVGYLKLGQPSTTLSGGEAQRVKLASELHKTSRGHALYILDEPTVGLHKADIQFLLRALNSIVDQQNTVIVIEHDLDVISQADHIIDLGPEGGDFGGKLMIQGNPLLVMACTESYTGQALSGAFQDISTSSLNQIPPLENIRFSGVTTNNLKNIDIEIPLNEITVITGVSGSGKSSMAFDTLFSESRNRFTEGFSTFARRMMSKVKKPELEQCSGLTPAIAIRQNQFGNNPRSTVGTVSELYDHYRLLFSRAGKLPDGSAAGQPASMFSFNKLEAACETCKGLGIITVADPEKFITHPEKSILEGAMDGTSPGKYFGDIYGQHVNTLLKVGEVLDLNFNLPYEDLSAQAKQIALYGTGETTYDVEWKFKRGNRSGSHHMTTAWKGMAEYIIEDYEIKRDGKRGEAFLSIISEISCPACCGHRLKPDLLKIKFEDLNISELSSLTMTSAKAFFNRFKQNASTEEQLISKQIIEQLIQKFDTLESLGLGYLSVDRPTATLSGGEAQRLRIASQLVSNLCGLTYVLDEPTIGLHSRDTENLMMTIRKLKEMGNTIVLVEHDPEVISQADHIIDFGPGAGKLGGEIIAQGNLSEILVNPNSVTGKYLTRKVVDRKKPVRNLKMGLQVKKAFANNLNNINLNIPTNGIVTITGVSGSGKTSLAFDVIAQSLLAKQPIKCDEITYEAFDHVAIIDQQRIGTSPSSTPATYTGVFDLIRDIFASLPESKAHGFKKSHFSFNNPEGRCETCKGMGQTKVSLDFLSDVWVECESCHGSRFKKPILDVRLDGLNINEVLRLEIAVARDIFQNNSRMRNKLAMLNEIGLGYIQLGQATNSLSGGETQRLKLAHELMKETKGHCLYIFDEPSTGLHMQDVEKLILVFNKLADQGHSVLIVEHNQDIIQSSDWIIELGPGGGDQGGCIVYEGIPKLN